MATTSSTASSTTAMGVFSRPRRRIRQLSDADVEALRQEELDALPRVGTSMVYTVDDFCRRLDDAVLRVAYLRQEYNDEGQRDWWHMADLLDDLWDLRLAIHGNSSRAPIVKLAELDGSYANERALCIKVQARNLARSQTSPEGRQRHASSEEMRQERLSSLDLRAGPSIDSANKWRERMLDAVLCVADRRETYKAQERTDWWHMADLLDDLADLMDAIRANKHFGTLPTLSVLDA